MSARLYVIAGKVTHSVTHGFLPAAARLGLDTTVLTDRVADHEQAYQGAVRVTGCDVTDFRSIISAAGNADVIFSNSDHLQAPTALAAAYYDLPGKCWRAATRTKNKALMRRHLAGLGLDEVFCRTLEPGADPTGIGGPYPLVVKPREGVASEDVVLAADPVELAAQCRQIRARRDDALLIEEYLPGELHTLETLGDGRALTVLGSFHTAVSEPPYFIEERLTWAPPPARDQVLAQLTALGVGFGACHTEYVVSGGRARLIEVNYRVIGDDCDFLLADLLGVPLFEQILRVHRGEPAPAPVRSADHAIAEPVLADRSGTLTAAPPPADEATGGVRLKYRPTREVGDVITLTHTNRDYLGSIRVIAPTPAQAESALTRFRTTHAWKITPLTRGESSLPGPRKRRLATSQREAGLAGRVFGALVREGYGGLEGGGSVLSLGGVVEAVRAVADPRDGVAAFAQECRDALAAIRLHAAQREDVLDRLRLADQPAGTGRLGATTWYDSLAAAVDHPVYPLSAARRGLTEADLLAYAPEFYPSFPLRWVAVPREAPGSASAIHATTAGGPRPAWWPDPVDLGLPSAHTVFPVHPLTARLRRLPAGSVLAAEPYLTVRPTLSMRTVTADGRTHLKLPLPTSTLGLRNVRSIKPGTLADGARVQRVLSAILDREPDLAVVLAGEQSYGHAGHEYLGYLLRTFPPETEGAHVAPVAALLARAPGGPYVIEELAGAYGTGVEEIFADYLTTLMRWNVRLFTRYGIALEAHQQNVSLVVRSGDLRILIKDNDAPLIDIKRLRQALGAQAPKPADFADERLLASDQEALARVFVTITLHLCAGTIAFGLAERGLVEPSTGLGLVRDRLALALTEAADDASTRRLADFLRARTLDADRLPSKAMLTAGTLVGKDRTGASDINKYYGPTVPNYLREIRT